VTADQTVLYIHLLALLLLTGAAAVTHVAYAAMRRARTLSEADGWRRLSASAARAFRVAALGLVASGAYLVSDRWSWGAAWVIAGLVGLAVIVALGELLHGRHGRALGRAIAEARGPHGDGPVTVRVARVLESRLAIASSYAPTLLMLGVVYLMVAKPAEPRVCVMALAVPLVLAGVTGALLAHPPVGVWAEADSAP
jgi:hypothetical protein